MLSIFVRNVPEFVGSTFRVLTNTDRRAAMIQCANLNGRIDKFDAGSLDQSRMEDMVRSHFQSLYVRINNNTNDQDFIPDDGEIDGRDRSRWKESTSRKSSTTSWCCWSTDRFLRA